MTPARRTVLLLAGILGCFLFLAGRLFALQIVRGGHYEELATRRVRRIDWTTPMRGTILDRAGEVLACDRVVYDLDVVIPDLVFVGSYDVLVANLEAAFRLGGSRVTRRDLLEGLDAAYERIEEAVAAEMRRQGIAPGAAGRKRSLSTRQLELIQGMPQPFLKDVEREACLFIEANPERYPGIAVRCRYARERPMKDLFAPLVGAVGPLGPADISRLRAKGMFLPSLREEYGRHYILTDPFYRRNAYEYSDRIGRTGLEKALEDRLRGVRGVSITERNRRGAVEITTAIPFDPEPPTAGEVIRLSASAEIQREAVHALAGESGAAVAMDPKTGEILALVSSPAPPPGGLNKAIRGTPPPASTVKIAAAVAGLEEGVIDPSTVVECHKHYQAPGVVLGCWSAHGAVNLGEALEHSCNTYFYEVASRLKKKKRIGEWMRRFGFGEVTGLELSTEELPGEVPPTEDYLTAIGQGRFQATPLQVARMAAVIVNGGFLVRPHLVRDAPLLAEDLGISAKTLAAVREGMRRVVESGTAAGRGLSGLEAAGKTGTAQVVSGRTAHAWFVGYAPHSDPKVVVSVFIEEGLAGGGERAAPVAAQILAKALEVLHAERTASR